MRIFSIESEPDFLTSSARLRSTAVTSVNFCRNNYGFHKAFEPDERRAHDGTLEYTSRDAHIGAHSRRGDLETLGYNMVHWSAGVLPWLKDMNPAAPEAVENQKKVVRATLGGFLVRCFQPEEAPPVLEEYLRLVASLEFDTCPDYEKIRQLFADTIQTFGKVAGEGKLVFAKPALKKKGSRKVRKVTEDENARSGFDDELSRGFEDVSLDENSRGNYTPCHLGNFLFLFSVIFFCFTVRCALYRYGAQKTMFLTVLLSFIDWSIASFQILNRVLVRFVPYR